MTDSRVSWRHGELLFDGGAWIIKDLGSTNGTFLGPQRLDRIEIGADCVVRLGNPDDGPVLRCVPQVPAAAGRQAGSPPADHPGTALSAFSRPVRSGSRAAPRLRVLVAAGPGGRTRVATRRSRPGRPRPLPCRPSLPRRAVVPRRPSPPRRVSASTPRGTPCRGGRPVGRAGPAAERGPQAHGADAAAG